MGKVLIVDDSIMMRKILRDIVESQGFTAIEAQNGLEAIEQYNVNVPDIITMDITMPEMNGLQALQELKKLNPNVKVIMVTAMGQESIVVEAIKNGAIDFIVKPFDREKIINTMNRIVGS